MSRLAVIGLGSMGQNHARVLRTLPGVELVAVCDELPGPAGPEPRYTSVDDLLERARLDAAIVAVPTTAHRDVALRCIRRGVAVLIEKPLAASVDEGRELQEAARATGVRVAVGHIERFNPVVTALKRELAGKDVTSLNIIRVGPVPPRVKDVGVLTDLSVHDIDLIRFLTGREIRDQAIYCSRRTPGEREDNAILTFDLEGDTIASVTTNWLTPFKKRTIEIATRQGYYEADLMKQDLLEYSSYRFDNSYVVRHCSVHKGEPLVLELRAFATFLETGERGMLASIDDALITLEVIA